MRIIITDDNERKNLIAEIWYGEKMIAEVNSENEEIEIEFFEIKGLVLNFYEFTNVIQNVKIKMEEINKNIIK